MIDVNQMAKCLTQLLIKHKCIKRSNFVKLINGRVEVKIVVDKMNNLLKFSGNNINMELINGEEYVVINSVLPISIGNLDQLVNVKKKSKKNEYVIESKLESEIEKNGKNRERNEENKRNEIWSNNNIQRKESINSNINHKTINKKQMEKDKQREEEKEEEEEEEEEKAKEGEEKEEKEAKEEENKNIIPFVSIKREDMRFINEQPYFYVNDIYGINDINTFSNSQNVDSHDLMEIQKPKNSVAKVKNSKRRRNKYHLISREILYGCKLNIFDLEIYCLIVNYIIRNRTVLKLSNKRHILEKMFSNLKIHTARQKIIILNSLVNNNWIKLKNKNEIALGKRFYTDLYRSVKNKVSVLCRSCKKLLAIEDKECPDCTNFTKYNS